MLCIYYFLIKRKELLGQPNSYHTCIVEKGLKEKSS